ncbi:tRNA nuclease CdiA-2 [Pandoraea anapnoica]|uniref:tRNA nuclease CdiA-2 n=2 Tax=Pandoraea anapnoica TaxID=2508301 RepID=A0A5E5ATT0_9BURK|nr:tRNA nuclease CdiA-2 [Pandoraea anapnoica]
MAIFGQSVIQAGVQSTIQGGSFLEALKASGVSNLSAALAFQIGDAKGDLSQIFGQNGGEIVSTIAHGALGCASAAAQVRLRWAMVVRVVRLAARLVLH